MTNDKFHKYSTIYIYKFLLSSVVENNIEGTTILYL